MGVILLIRYVIMPFFTAEVGYSSWCKNIPSSSDYLIAQILMISEIIMITILFRFYDNEKKKKEEENVNNNLDNKSNNSVLINKHFDGVILIFSIISILLFIFLRKKYNINVYFIIPNEELTSYDSNNIRQILILFFNTAKAFVFLFVLKKVYLKNRKSIFDIMFVLIFAAMNVLIYTGTNRIQLILSFICSVYLILLIFPKLKKILYGLSLAAFIIIIPAISTYRQSELLTSNSTLYDYSQLSNVYLGGVDNVAISVETANVFPQYRNLNNFLYDMFRGVLGINVLLKNSNSHVLESDLFNFVYFGHSENSSQIVPIVGQGYYYFDIVGFWIIELFFLFLGLKLEKVFVNTKNIYFKYTLMLILLRFSIMQGLSGTILAHSISFDCFIPWIIIMVNDAIKTRRDDYYEKI